MTDATLPLMLLAAAMAFGAFVKGAIGFGFNLVAIPVLALIMDARTAVVLVVIPSLLTNPAVIFQVGAARRELRRMAPVLITIAIGAWLGAQVLVWVSAAALSAMVGISAMVFTLASVLKLKTKISPHREASIGPLVGLVSGVVAGATNIYGPVVAAYFQSLGLDKRTFVIAFALVFVVTGSAQLVSYASLGLFTLPILLISLLSCVPMLLGLRLGVYAQDRISTLWFNRIVLAVIFVSGISLILR